MIFSTYRSLSIEAEHYMKSASLGHSGFGLVHCLLSAHKIWLMDYDIAKDSGSMIHFSSFIIFYEQGTLFNKSRKNIR